MSRLHPPHTRRSAAFTLVELAMVLAAIGIVVSLAIPSLGSWAANQRLTSSARDVANAFSLARSEAIRTGNVHAVFVETDADSLPLPSPVLVLDDGQLGSPDQNCDIDAGESTTSFGLETGVGFGVTVATTKVPTDPGGAPLGTSSFVDAGGNPASWVLFRPEGTPLAFSGDCSTGGIGTGGGGIYLTNGTRDVAVVVTPLGATRLHSWNRDSGSWTP